MKQRIKDGLVLLLFLVLLPYIMGIMSKTKEEGVGWMNMETMEEKEEATNFVRYEDELHIQEIPLEEFLVGALAATVPITYEKELLKAQAVLLRSTCCAEMEREGTVSGQGMEKKIIEWNKIGTGYLTRSQMKKIWKEDYEVHYKKVEEAVEETKGIIITYQETPIEGTYHAMSGGKTRNGMDILKEEDYSFLESVFCEKNVESGEFLQTVSISKKQIQMLSIENRDEAGYVTAVICDGEKLTGEQFREKYGLASANFTFEEKEEEFVITTKGMGHGLGMDQYYGNYLAKNQYSYTEILDYFFKDTKLSKIAE
ncbi:MAG: hypothetical protein HDR01_00240 [Lachnospiraceae bacterium]|nr:hypothetical protein [Lachnospiraceae bacterium]